MSKRTGSPRWRNLDDSPERRWARQHLRPGADPFFQRPAYLQSRRDALLRCIGFGTLTLASSLRLADVLDAWSSPPLQPTAWNELGPFYRKGAPQTSHLRLPADPGVPLSVSGRILDTRGEAVPGAALEIWHTDDAGHYDLAGYHFRSSLISDESGAYAFDSIVPGHYPSRVCQHVHYLVRARGCKLLTTQLYFATDPVFEGNPDRNYTKDPLIRSRDLVRPVALSGAAGNMRASASFDIVLERA